MGDSSNEVNNSIQDKELERIRRSIQKKSEAYEKMLANRDSFLETNDKKLSNVRERNDESLQKKRKRTDERIASNRKRIDERYKDLSPERRERLQKWKDKTDQNLAKHRERHDKARTMHRDFVDDRRKKHDDRVNKYFEEERIKNDNRLKRIQGKNGKRIIRIRKRVVFITVILLFFVILMVERIVPSSKLKKEGVMDDTPIEEKIEVVDEKEYATLKGTTEEQLLWDLLMVHFDGNKTAVLGVMCNLNSESELHSKNLEDYNNELWGIDDENYTEKVNRKTIDKNDFMQSRINNISNGYYNKYNEWVNKDGGYGYAQYTSFDKKMQLYQFAETWFGPGGEGEDYKFNIGDPEMQAHFIVYLLESEEYKDMDYMIRNSQNVVDSCYYWLKMYEIPYDPYNDGYYTLAFDRAAAADIIKAACDREK